MLNDINLIPDKIIYRKKKIFLVTGKIFFLFLLTVIILTLLLYRSYHRWELQQKVVALSAEIDNGALNELRDTRKKLEMRINELRQIDILYESMPSQNVKVTELVERVALLMPVSITAQSVKYDLGTSEIAFDLISESREDISTFMKRLYNDSLYSDINISEIRGSENRFLFELVIKVK